MKENLLLYHLQKAIRPSSSHHILGKTQVNKLFNGSFHPNHTSNASKSLPQEKNSRLKCEEKTVYDTQDSNQRLSPNKRKKGVKALARLSNENYIS